LIKYRLPFRSFFLSYVRVAVAVMFETIVLAVAVAMAVAVEGNIG
jgi:hypothetical protein